MRRQEGLGGWWHGRQGCGGAVSLRSSSLTSQHRVATAAHCGAWRGGQGQGDRSGGQTEVPHGRDLPHPPGSPSAPHWAPSPLLLRLRQHRLLRLRHLRLRRRHLLRLWLRQHMYLAMVLDGTGPDAQSRGTSLVEPANLWAGGTSWAVSPGPTPVPLIDTGGGPGHCEVTEAWTSQTPPHPGCRGPDCVHIWTCGRPRGGDRVGPFGSRWGPLPPPGHQPRGDKEGPLCKGLSVCPSFSYSVNTKLLHTSLLGARFWARPLHPGTNKAGMFLPNQLCK